MEYEYVLITSIPVFKNNGIYYTDNTWAKDIQGQLGLWKKLHVVCPIKNIQEKPENLTIPSNQINFITFSNYLDFYNVMRKMFKKQNIIFEFAGTSIHGVLGFSLAKFFNKVNLNFITFDGPLAMAIKQTSHLSIKRVIAIFYVKLFKSFRKWATKNAKGVLSVGIGIIDEFDPQRKYDAKYFVIPLTLFDEEDILIRDNLDNTLLKIGCIDRLSPEKGVYELMNAFNEVINECPQLELHIYGTGPQEDIIKNFAQKNHLESIVYFHGFVSHDMIMRELETIDILVNLTKVGDINRTMWEGAAKGCAIIASDTIGVRSFFKNKENAILVDPENVKDIADALSILCKNQKMRYELSRNSTILASKYTNKKVKIIRKKWINKMINNN